MFLFSSAFVEIQTSLFIKLDYAFFLYHIIFLHNRHKTSIFLTFILIEYTNVSLYMRLNIFLIFFFSI